MPRLPWVKWFPADWASEPGLRICCAATRGIWADALNSMMLSQSDRVEGTIAQLARLCRCTEGEMSTALEEISSMQIALVRMQNGCITIKSRRLSRDKDLSNLRRKAANTRWCKRDACALQTYDANGHAPSEYAYASASVSKRKKRAESEAELVQYCVQRGLKETDGQWLWAKWEGNGWRNGKEPIRDYECTVRQWKLQGIFPSQKNGSNGSGRVARTDPNQQRLDDEYERHRQEMLKKKGQQ